MRSVQRRKVFPNISYALVLVFRDEAQHDAYQVDPLHQQLVANCKPLCPSVRIFYSFG